MEDKNLHWVHIFTAGKYPQGNISADDLKLIAECYDPEGIHEAFFMRGHIDWKILGADAEPEALAWAKELKAEGDKLFALYSDENEDFVNYVQSKKFKRVSCEIAPYEFVTYEQSDKYKFYLYCIGLTNRPAVNGLKPLSYDKEKKFRRLKSYNSLLKFEMDFNKLNNSNIMLEEKIKQFAQRFGINITEYNTAESILDYVAAEVGKLQVRFADDPNAVTALNISVEKAISCYTKAETLETKVSELEGKVTQYERQKEETDILEAVNTAIVEGKAVPAQKDALIKFAKSNPAGFTAMVAELPKLDIFKTDMVPTGEGKIVDPEDAVYKDKDGNKITFSSYCKMTSSKKPEDVERVKLLKQDDKYKNLPGYVE